MPQELNDSGWDRTKSQQNLLTLDDYQVLANTARELTRELATESLLNSILETAGQLTDSPETSIILSNDSQPTLYFAAATGDDSDWVLSTYGIHSEKQIPIEGSKAGYVYTSGKSIVENVVEDHFSGVDNETQTITKSMVCVPLIVGDQRLGVMQVLNKQSGDYTERDCVVLEHFADQASVAIRNSRLMENLLTHSGLYGRTRTTDELFSRLRELHQDAKTETLTVMFADMRGFTQLCQTLINPVLVQEKLNEFISMLTRSILDHEGVINKFLGDGVMALFQGDNSSVRAVKCAFAMVQDFLEMRDRWDEESNQQLDFLDLGCGVTTDQVILGGVGVSGVRDYTAIGTAVNLAAAFEGAARNGRRILCDQHTFRKVKDMVSEVQAPEDFLLQKPGQQVGVRYKCYHLESLQQKHQPRIFISHSHDDRKFVEQLIERLKVSGLDTWYSADDIPKGSLWTAEIRKAISRCDWMTVIVSKNSSNSKWIRREVDLAFASDHLEERIIPVSIDGTELSKVNEYLTTLQAIEQSEVDAIADGLLAQCRVDI